MITKLFLQLVMVTFDTSIKVSEIYNKNTLRLVNSANRKIWI